MNKKIISLIMVNYNRDQYLDEAIKSVIEQNNDNWELIIVDDASRDNSIKIITKYLDNKKIKLVVNKRHRGIVYSRILAIKKSCGKIIGIIDSDDFLDKEAVGTMFEAHTKNKNGLIYSQMMVCDENLKPLYIGGNDQIKTNSNNLIKNSISHFFTFKKSDYLQTSGYDPVFNLCAEDKDLFYKLEEVTDPLFIDKVLYYYRVNPSSVSNYGLKKINGKFLYFLAKFKAYKRRKNNNSPKQIKFMEIFPQRRIINTTKSILNRIYFPFLTSRAIKLFKLKSGNAKTPEELWQIANNFRYGLNIRGLNINIKPAQVPEEIIKLMTAVQKIQPKIILEIGTATGGTLFFWTKIASSEALIISLDLPFGKFGDGYLSCQKRLFSSFSKEKQKLEFIQEDSHKPETLEQIKKILNGNKLDFLFIDGDHSYKGVRQDFENYKNLVRAGGLVALHDIAPNKTDQDSQVDKFWSEIKNQYEAEEFIIDNNQGWAGIGLIYI